MSFFADKVTNIQIDASRRFPVLTADVALGFEFIQFYQAGALVGSARAVNGGVTFASSIPGPIDPFFPLAVDPEDVNTNFWDLAFPEAASAGNRIKVSIQTTLAMRLGDRFRISIDGTIVHEADIYPTSDGAGGYGVSFGVSYGRGPFGGGYGREYGVNYGHGGGIVLEWVSEPLFIGTYAVAVNIIDKAGNVSSSTTTNVTLATYPRPATDLVVSSYDSGTDTLTLGWGESEDI